MPYSKAHRDDVCGYTCVENGSWKEGVYTRVHRDFKIIKALRQWMGLSTGVSPSDVGLPSHCQWFLRVIIIEIILINIVRKDHKRSGIIIP